MEQDSFINNQKNIFNQKISEENENNFFLHSEPRSMHSEHVKRLNDYDYNILKEDAYKDVSDEVFKLEYKISKAEDELKNIDKQIQAAKDIHDFNLVEKLFNKKKILEEDLKGLIEIYNDTSLSAKISGGITNKFKEQIAVGKKVLNGLSEVIISKLPKRFSTVLEIKKSLSKLENISKNVDELMTLQTPYGEAGDKYEQLSKYITRANAIQAEISKSLK